MNPKKQCLIITSQVTDYIRLGEWLSNRGYEIQFAKTAAEIIEKAAAQVYDLVLLHPGQWHLHLLQQFKVLHSFGLISGRRDCYPEHLDHQVSIHVREPFRPSQFLRLERALKSNSNLLLADCLIVKSQWHYHKIPLEQIDFLERDKVPGYTRICYGRNRIVVFGILTAWERSLHCTGLFERIGDNILVAKKHLTSISNGYFMIDHYRIKVMARYIETKAYRKIKEKFPVINMHLQGVATQPVNT